MAEALALAAAALAGAFTPPVAAGSAPPTVVGLTAWAVSGSRLAFVASAVGGRRGYLWVENPGSNRPALLRSGPPSGQEEIDQLAPGPRGTWGCLEHTVGNTGSYYSVDLLSRRGGGTQVATAGGRTGTGGGVPVASIPTLVGDGSFLGYLYVTRAGVVQLFQVTRHGQGKRIANLAGAGAPQEAVVAFGNLAIRESDGTVRLFTLGGQPLATIGANAASIALTVNRVVVRTRDRRLVVYGLRGGLVHSWPLRARSWTGGLAVYGRYAVYLGANKAVRGVRLSNGHDVVVARAGGGWFLNGLGLQAPGAIFPLTTQQGKRFPTTFRFLPTAVLRAALG